MSISRLDANPDAPEEEAAPRAGGRAGGPDPQKAPAGPTVACEQEHFTLPTGAGTLPSPSGRGASIPQREMA